MEEVNPDPPKPQKKKKAATKRKGQTTREGGGKATKGVVEKKEKHVAAKGAGVVQPRGGEGKKVGGEAPAGLQVWVPYPKGVKKGVVVGNVKGGKHKWVLFGTRDTPYKVAAHLCYAIEATATAQWQKATRGGGEATQEARPTEADEAANQAPTPKPPEAGVEPTIWSASAQPATRSAPTEPGTRSAEDRARDTQALWEAPSSREL